MAEGRTHTLFIFQKPTPSSFLMCPHVLAMWLTMNRVAKGAEALKGPGLIESQHLLCMETSPCRSKPFGLENQPSFEKSKFRHHGVSVTENTSPVREDRHLLEQNGGHLMQNYHTNLVHTDIRSR